MKTKELVSGLKEIGYLVEREAIGCDSEYLAISTADSYLIATVSEKSYGMLNTDIYTGYNDSQEHNVVFRMLIKYAMTPLDEREDAKKHFVKMFPEGDNYLNQNREDNHIFLSSRDETEMYKTQFTEKEYKELRSKYSQWLPKFDKDDPHFIEVQEDEYEEG